MVRIVFQTMYRNKILLILLVIKPHSSYELFEVNAFNAYERSILYQLHIKNESIVFINGVTNEAAIPMVVIVDTCCVNEFKSTLVKNEIDYNQWKMNSGGYYKSDTGYIKWQNINRWIKEQQKKYPTLQRQKIGLTHEDRDIIALSIVKNINNPIAVVVSGEQGRDWMSASIVLKLIKHILGSKQFKPLIDFYSFYFIPILNPDGYVYSMEKDKFWAKNRNIPFPKKKCISQEQSNIDSLAIGVNIERNWFEETTINYGEDSCNSIFLGFKSLSEKETRALANFLYNHSSTLMAFVNVVGNYNSLITLPYNQRLKNKAVMLKILKHACEEVNIKHKVSYLYGETDSFFCGCSDWVKKVLNVPLVYTVYMTNYDNNASNYTQADLSQQLATIVWETLMISKQIYGPLYNQQCKIIIKTFLFILILVNV